MTDKPLEPKGGDLVWYRGWECSYEWQREYYTGEGFTAYRGGCDLDARCLSAGRWDDLLLLVDDEEDP